jgi:putative selenate reductase
LNAHEVTARVTGDPRYGAGKNGKPPRKVGSQLVLLDCLSCDKCVPVCPNDANFSIDTPPEEVGYDDLVLDEVGQVSTRTGGRFIVQKPSQWASYADACNECGNCDVFCPEDGGPYVVKARFFGSHASFSATPELDGLLIEQEAGGMLVHARLQGRPVELRLAANGTAVLTDGHIRAEYDPASARLLGATPLAGARGPHVLPGTLFLTLRTLVRGALDGRRLNPVSAAHPNINWPA